MAQFTQTLETMDNYSMRGTFALVTYCVKFIQWDSTENDFNSWSITLNTLQSGHLPKPGTYSVVSDWLYLAFILLSTINNKIETSVNKWTTYYTFLLRFYYNLDQLDNDNIRLGIQSFIKRTFCLLCYCRKKNIQRII